MTVPSCHSTAGHLTYYAELIGTSLLSMRTVRDTILTPKRERQATLDRVTFTDNTTMTTCQDDFFSQILGNARVLRLHAGAEGVSWIGQQAFCARATRCAAAAALQLSHSALRPCILMTRRTKLLPAERPPASSSAGVPIALALRRSSSSARRLFPGSMRTRPGRHLCNQEQSAADDGSGQAGCIECFTKHEYGNGARIMANDANLSAPKDLALCGRADSVPD